MRLRAVALGLSLVASIVSTASAQGMRDRIRELFSFGQCGRPLCLDGSITAANGHGDHFIPDLIARNGAILGFLADAIAANASNLPLSSSASGETYRFVGGLPVKTSGSLGPIFGERYQTLGKGRWVVGTNMTGVNFTSMRGVPMNDIILNFTHDDVPPAGLGQPVRENDILQVTLDLNVNLLVTTFFATWGATDKLDLSLAVPIVHTGLTGRSHGQFLPFGFPTSHFFAGDSLHPVLSADATTYGFETGLGDIAVRAKWVAWSNDKSGLSVMGDARLPTGSTEDLTGSGKVSIRALAIGSARFGDFSPHANVGYFMRGGYNDYLLGTLGFDHPLSSWATLAIDVLSEWQVGESSLELPGDVTYQFPVERHVTPTNIPNIDDHRVNGSFGMKFKTPGGPILIANGLIPLRRGGLESRFIWTVGIDANF